MKAIVKPVVILFLILFLSSGMVWADGFMLDDTYIGSGATHPYYSDRDVIGNPDDFDILGLNASVTSDLLKVEIYSTYFDDSSMGLYDTALGDLFISVDTYIWGEEEQWEYVAVLDNHGATSGSVSLFSIESGGIVWSQDLTSSSYIFRSGQEVQFKPEDNAIATGTWAIDNNWLSIYIGGDDILPVTTEIGFHYAMTCGNDVIEGGVAPVPEPATMVLLGTGLIGLAGISRRRSRKSA